MTAAKSGQIEVVQYLIAKGVTLDTKNKSNNTAFMIANKSGNSGIATLLRSAYIAQNSAVATTTPSAPSISGAGSGAGGRAGAGPWSETQGTHRMLFGYKSITSPSADEATKKQKEIKKPKTTRQTKVKEKSSKIKKTKEEKKNNKP
jgi:ankyrin repeat protein